jgi:hypothetical protein
MTVSVCFLNILASNQEASGHLLDSMFTSGMGLRGVLLSESIHPFQRKSLKNCRIKRRAGSVSQAGTWDRSGKVVPKIPWRRQYIFTCPISFRDRIYTSRFQFDINQKKSGIKLIWSEKTSCGTSEGGRGIENTKSAWWRYSISTIVKRERTSQRHIWRDWLVLTNRLEALGSWEQGQVVRPPWQTRLIILPSILSPIWSYEPQLRPN